jgi:hypothetical protein
MASKYRVMLDSNFLIGKCEPLCPLECNSSIYATSVSSVEVIGSFYADFVNGNSNILKDFETNSTVSPDEAKNNFVYIYLFYNSLSYTISTETPTMDIVALLANIGGTMGLFLGVSLLHVCELAEAFIELGFLAYEKRRKINASTSQAK